MTDNISPQTDSPAEGTVYWRSLEQLQDTPEFRELMHREFPEGITDAPDAVSRRNFLGVIAASVALAGLTGCRKPKTKIMPFNERPEGYLPGVPQYYASTFTRGGYGFGVVVKSSDGRPTKVEGNERHPASLGGSDQFVQAELLNLYDPARSRHARRGQPVADDHGGGHGASTPTPSAWDEFLDFWRGRGVGEAGHAAKLVQRRGAGLRVLMQPTASPTMVHMVGKLHEMFPDARVHTWTPLHRDNEARGTRLALGAPMEVHHALDKADLVVSLDCDFLGLDGQNVANARKWAKRRKITGPDQQTSRLYVAEASYSTTGTVADHRLRLRAAEVPVLAAALAAELGVGEGGDLATALEPFADEDFPPMGKSWVAALAADLRAHRGRSAVLVGPRQPAVVHALAAAINAALGNTDEIVQYTALPDALAQGQVESVRALARDIEAGNVDTMVFLDTNPVYDAPADLGFARMLAEGKLAHTIHLGRYDDETGSLCEWHFPMAHELEAWGDARAADGTVSLTQPLVAPLHGGASAIEFLAVLVDHPVLDQHPLTGEHGPDGSTGHELVRAYWQANSGSADFESWWKRVLHDGLVEGSAARPTAAQVDAGAVAAAVRDLQRPAAAGLDDVEVVLRADPRVLDGRFANNPWLQEMPDPVTKLTWDNAALLSKRTAAELGVEDGDLISVTAPGGSAIEVPVWRLPGHADYSITLTLGSGRALGPECKVANGAGFDAYRLRTADSQHLVRARVARAGGSYMLVSTQNQGTMVGRPIVRENDLAAFRSDPEWAQKLSPLDQMARLQGKREKDLALSLWEERDYSPQSDDPAVAATPYQWGMVIDLNSCTGCSACVVACVAENNIPVVGKTQVSRGREMQWIRLDRYFASDAENTMEPADDPGVVHMPVPCMQCENAPCESVCPVNATVHSPEGLNDMAYNRCIGTRYCSNNCPYKVRRFNWFDFHGKVADTEKMAFNPDVTVRHRGVMEKCTYCVQRINKAKLDAKLEDRRVRDGELSTACAQACPTEAITFGNILDEDSRVSQLKRSPLNYGVLSEMNTKPRTTYLGRIRNPNPELS